MEEKADSEQSYSGESSSSSTESSSGTSDSDEEVFEPIRILGQNLEIPQELCEDPEIFKEFFSMKTWECLEEEDKDHLKQFLPNFPDDDDDVKEATVKMLLEHEPFHFVSPLQTFHKNLRQGNFRPDIAKMRKFLRKARAKQQKHKRKAYYAKLLPEVLLSRERVLAGARSAPPGSAPYIPPLPPKPSMRSNYKPIYMRARHRYFEELAAIWSEVGGDESEDDNYPEGPPEVYRKRKQPNSVQNAESSVSGTLGGGEPSHLKSLECLKNVLAIHRARRQYRENHPELNIAGITLDDIKQRVALINGTKKLMFGGPKTETPIQRLKKGSKRDGYPKQVKVDTKGGKKGKEDLESVETKPLLPNIKIKCEQEESDSENSSFLDPITTSPHKKLLENIEIKKEVDANCSTISNMSYSESELETVIKQEPPDTTNPISNSGKTCHQPVPIKLEDLDGIDMMALPVEIVDDTGEVLPGDSPTEPSDEPMVEADEPLTETTHANFLSLVRALFPARTAHRASKQQLHARCAAVMRSPIAPLNTWYSLCNDWCAELDSALDFLAGERGPHPDDFVPYLQYIPETLMYQWIGAGRDCDALLGRLCERWLRAIAPRARDKPDAVDAAPAARQTPPWVVRPPTNSELIDFRAQERKRFSTSTKPFTYIQHGFRFAVGPAGGGGAGGAGAGGALLATQRPRAATFPTLVRDALSRLPHGEGSRRDILTLLRMSQWILPCSDQTLSSALSLALDKLLSAKRDPVVKFDVKSSIWTYLHRNRTEEDWLKCSKRGKASIATRPAHSSPELMEVEMASVDEAGENNASDSDVDVDDMGAPPAASQLSSAQLLMQATAAHPRPPPPKPKGKLVAAPQKPKPKVQAKPSTVQTPKQVSFATKSKTVGAAQAAAQTKNVKQSGQGKQAQGGKQSASAKQGSVTTQPVTVPVGVQSPKKTSLVKTNVMPVVKTVSVPPLAKTESVITVAKSPSTVAPPQKSPLSKNKTVKPEPTPAAVNTVHTPTTSSHIIASIPSVIQTAVSIAVQQTQPKLTQMTRSLLIKPSTLPTTSTPTDATAVVSSPATQTTTNIRRGVVRVLSPATPSSGKSLISPRALLQQTATTTSKKRVTVASTTSVTAVAQSSVSTSVVSSQPTVVTPSVVTRTVQLGGRTVQLANQTVHLPGGQAVQLSSGHTLQLSSLQPTHSVRLPSGQTVQLASPAVQAVRAISMQVKNPSSRPQSPAIRPVLQGGQQPTVQIPVSTVQLAGQTVQIAGQTVQLAGQSVQLTGHTVKLPSGQSVQVASQSVMPSQSVHTVQLAAGVQLTGQNVLSGQSVQGGQSVHLGSQTVQIGGQTVQLAGQTVQLPGGQTLQLSGGQTVQLSNGQTIQLASGQALQLANQPPKSIAQVVRTQTAGDKSTQPIVAKLLTNAQGQMISLDGMLGARARGGVRVVSPATRLARPLLLTSAKPLHNIILQSDGSAIRVTSSVGATTSQTIVLSNIGGQASTTSSSSTPVLKLQQVNPIHQVKLPQGIKLQQAVTNATVPTSGGVRSVLMDGQQLKLVGGRHVLARLLKPANPPP